MGCADLAAITEPVSPGADGCQDCLASGHHDWVHLRLCMDCGHVGCCDSSPRRHATAHVAQATHPVVQSFEPGEDWGWCYDHEAVVAALPAKVLASHS